MTKITTTILFIVLAFSSGIKAQDISLTGIILDEKDQVLPGAQVVLQHPWGETIKGTVTDENGQFFLKQLDPGGYKLEISFIGFATLQKEVTLKNESMDLGRIQLKETAIELEQVEVKEKIPLATQNGDTTDYAAKAYKVLPDANAEDLIKKMPGVVIQNGKVTAQGEDVKEVLVDGKPFFGNDPNAALKNLPAEIISKIQIFDQRSDQANFTGFDDGETSKVINIVTKVDMKTGQFGKLYAGYGLDNFYQAGGSTNFFNGDQRISLIGQTNNINIQNFAAEDLLGVLGNSGRRRGRGRRGGGGSSNDFLVEQQGGIAETHAFGLNYSDKWGEKWEVNGSYFFNITDNIAEESVQQNFVDGERTTQTYFENTISETQNINHRLNARMTYKIDDRNSIIFRPRLSIQQNEGSSLTEGITQREGNGTSFSQNDFNSDLTAIDFNNNMLWRHRFEKRRRTLSLNLRTGYTQNNGDNQLFSENDLDRGGSIIDTLDQFSDLTSDGWDLNANLSFTEPVGERNMLMFNYQTSLKLEDSDKKTFDFSDGDQSYTDLNEGLSNVFNSRFTTHQLGTGINLRKSRAFFVMIRANLQYAQLKSEESFPLAGQIKENYYHVLPFAMLRMNYSKQENLRVFYRSSLQVPSINQLQDVVDNSNPLQLSIGNSNLDPAYSHRLFTRYSKTNPEKATVFYALLSATYTSNYISNATYLDSDLAPISLDRGVQLSQPVNLDGFWNTRAFITYGLPFRAIKSNLNFDVSTTFTRTPGLIDNRKNYANSLVNAIGLTISSNVSTRLDFSISTRSNINRVNNSLQDNQDQQFWQQNSTATLNWVLPGGIVLRTSMQHQYYEGLTDATDTNFWLWNASIGKKLFKDQLSEIALVGWDLLNQNQSISRNVTQTYIEEVETNILQRYFLLKFTYHFRNFNSGKAKSQQESERERRRREMGF